MLFALLLLLLMIIMIIADEEQKEVNPSVQSETFCFSYCGSG